MGLTSTQIQILASIYFLQFSMGLVFEIVGPTIDELSLLTNSTMDKISLIYSFRSTGYALGSLLGGGIFHFFIPLISLSCAIFINSMTIAFVAFTRNFGCFYAIFTINGFTTGLIDVATNVWVLRMFEQESGPYIMALYTCFSLGTAFAPIYTAPFLRESLKPSQESQLYIPYLITGFITLIPMIGFLSIFFQQMQLPLMMRIPFARGLKKAKPTIDRSSLSMGPRAYRVSALLERILVILTILMIMFYSGMEIIFSEYMVPMFNRSGLRITSPQASYIKSSMNIAYTIGKMAFIVISAFIRPFTIIIFDCGVVLLSTIMLIIYFDTSLSKIWIFSIVFGLGTSSLYPSMYPFIETFITVDHFKGSFFIFASGAIAIVYPIFLGDLLESFPTLLLYLKLLTLIITLFLALTINILGRRLNKTRQSTSPSNAEDQLERFEANVGHKDISNASHTQPQKSSTN